MRRRSLAVVAAIAALSAMILLAPTARAQRGSRLEREDVNGRAAVAREVLVKFRTPLRAAERAATAAQADADALEPVGTTGVVRLRSRSQSAAALIEALSRHPDVLYVEPNFIIQLSATPDDSRFSELWGLNQIGAPPAWDMTVGSNSSVVVGVIDTGIDYTHPDLAANVWSAPADFTVTVGSGPIHCSAGTHGFDAITRSCSPLDDHDHGSHVSGTIGAAGNNGVGVVGVNWMAHIMGIKVFDAQGNATVADTIAGVEFASAVKQAFQATDGANVRVLSASWGGPEFSQALFDEVNAAGEADMLFVAAAGNNGFSNDILPFYPASYGLPNVVAVAATSFGDTLAYFSNYGVSSVDLAAPGDFILSTTTGNTYGYMSGTSMAAPHVSGAAALVLSQCALDTVTLKETLLGTVDYVSGLTTTTVTGGRLNVDNALHACTAPPDTPAALTARGEDGRVLLQWTAAVGAMRYDLKRSLTAGGPYALLAPGVKGTAYADTDVVNDTTYYYVVSAENTQGASEDSNEASATPRTPSDLTVSAFTTPAVGGAGSPVTVSVTISNIGAGAAPPSLTRISLSVNSTLDTSDTALVDVSAPDLAPGGVASTSLTVPIPDGTTAARYYLIASTDADDTQYESNEGNNRAARSIQIGPDLAIDTFTAPAYGAPGAPVSVNEGTENRGGGAAPATTTLFYLSTNSTISADDALIGSRTVSSLAAGATNAGTTVLTIPATATVGTFYIVAVADGTNAVGETSETNNRSVRTIHIGGDLVVSTLTVPPEGAAGSTIVVTDTTTNQGSAPVGASTLRLYLSSNAAVDASDTLLAERRTVPALDAGASNSGPTSVALSASIAPGRYYIVATADGDGAVAETSETNNGFARQILIGGDLVVSSVTAPASAAGGTTIVVSDTTENRGAGSIAASTTRFYLSANSSLDGGDMLLEGARPVPALAGDASSSGSSSVTLPSNLTPATYYLIALADGDNAVTETIETNNSVARVIQIGGDLIVSTLTAPAKAGAGLPITLNETTTNQGLAPVGASVTKFYLSTNGSFDASDALIGSRIVPDLASSTSSSAATTVNIPSTIAPGTYYLLARADADGTVGETSESNNTKARSVAIGGDLVISVPSTSVLKAAVGSSVDFGDTVTNNGGGSAAPSVNRYYLSLNSTLSTDDVLLGAGRNVPGLVPGGSSAGVAAVWLPASVAPGLYYIVAKADGDNAVGETSETNNTKSRQVGIGPDLAVSATSAQTSAPAGTTITLTETVLNQGAQNASPTVTRIYLSTNTSFDASDVALGSGRAVSDVAAGASSTGSTAITIPSTTSPGVYYLLVKADADSAVAESYETNNMAARSISVKAP